MRPFLVMLVLVTALTMVPPAPGGFQDLPRPAVVMMLVPPRSRRRRGRRGRA